MSHFNTIQVKLSNREALVEALKFMFPGKEIEVHTEPQTMKDYYQNTQRANIIIRAVGGVGTQQSDLGFVWNPQTNSYDAILDEWALQRGGYLQYPDTDQDFLNELILRTKIVELQQQGHNVRLVQKQDGGYSLIAQKQTSKFQATATATATSKANKFQQVKR